MLKHEKVSSVENTWQQAQPRHPLNDGTFVLQVISWRNNSQTVLTTKARLMSFGLFWCSRYKMSFPSSPFVASSGFLKPINFLVEIKHWKENTGPVYCARKLSPMETVKTVMSMRCGPKRQQSTSNPDIVTGTTQNGAQLQIGCLTCHRVVWVATANAFSWQYLERKRWAEDMQGGTEWSK